MVSVYSIERATRKNAPQSVDSAYALKIILHQHEINTFWRAIFTPRWLCFVFSAICYFYLYILQKCKKFSFHCIDIDSMENEVTT
jgi:hypothetical protein